MKLRPRYEVHDYRDPEFRQPQLRPEYETYPPERQSSPSAWDGFKKAFGWLGATIFVGLTLWNVYTIGGWLSDWYAKKRDERAVRMGYWKRGHPRKWEEEVLPKYVYGE